MVLTLLFELDTMRFLPSASPVLVFGKADFVFRFFDHFGRFLSLVSHSHALSGISGFGNRAFYVHLTFALRSPRAFVFWIVFFPVFEDLYLKRD